ncbi:MAG: ATP-binding cassette domain-containing protein [Cyanobium sp. ELA712]
MTPILQVQNVDAHYGPIQALRDVSIEVNEGEIVTLIGANGAGKSTLLMSIFGQPRVSKGCIRFAGEDITGVQPHRIAKRGLAQLARRPAAGARAAGWALPGGTALRCTGGGVATVRRIEGLDGLPARSSQTEWRSPDGRPGLRHRSGDRAVDRQ